MQELGKCSGDGEKVDLRFDERGQGFDIFEGDFAAGLFGVKEFEDGVAAHQVGVGRHFLETREARFDVFAIAFESGLTAFDRLGELANGGFGLGIRGDETIFSGASVGFGFFELAAMCVEDWDFNIHADEISGAEGMTGPGAATVQGNIGPAISARDFDAGFGGGGFASGSDGSGRDGDRGIVQIALRNFPRLQRAGGGREAVGDREQAGELASFSEHIDARGFVVAGKDADFDFDAFQIVRARSATCHAAGNRVAQTSDFGQGVRENFGSSL